MEQVTTTSSTSSTEEQLLLLQHGILPSFELIPELISGPPHGFVSLHSPSCPLKYSGNPELDANAIRRRISDIMTTTDSMMKAGGCYGDLENSRPYHPGTYPAQVFEGPHILIMRGIDNVPDAVTLEQVTIDALGGQGVKQQVRSERHD